MANAQEKRQIALLSSMAFVWKRQGTERAMAASTS